MNKIGRNDACHCGSGKKYKNCHQQIDVQKKAPNNKNTLIGGAIIVIIILAAIALYFNLQSPANSAPGDAPAGKVWSSEHGHWHDAE
jgi:uncharacterized protein YchJ